MRLQKLPSVAKQKRQQIIKKKYAQHRATSAQPFMHKRCKLLSFYKNNLYFTFFFIFISVYVSFPIWDLIFGRKYTEYERKMYRKKIREEKVQNCIVSNAMM